MEITKEFMIITLIYLTEILGWTLILPFLPFFALSYGASPLIVGLILASFSIFQFISAPIIGRLSDKYGRKPLLILSQFSTMIGFLILGFANSLFMIFLSRAIDGLLGSNMVISNAYVTDITSEKDRTTAFNRLGLVFGIGMFVGPAVGGTLAVINFSLPSFLAAGMALISIILTILLVKETVTVEKEIRIRKQDFFPFQSLIKGLSRRALRFIFFEFLFYAIGFTLITSTIALFMDAQLSAGPEQVGILLMIIAVVRTTFQMGIIPKLLKRFNETVLMIIGLSVTAFAMFSFFFVRDLLLLYLGGCLFAIGGSLARPVIISTVSRKAKPHERGEFMGVFNSLESIAQMTTPIMGGFIIALFYPGILGVFAGLFVLTSIALALVQRRQITNNISIQET